MLCAGCDLQALLDDPGVAAVELSGVFVGPFTAVHDVTLRAAPGPTPVLVATDAWNGGAALEAVGVTLAVEGVGFVGALDVDGGAVTLDTVRFDTTRGCLRAVGAAVTVRRSRFETCGEAALDVTGGTLEVEDAVFRDGFLPAVHARDAARVRLRQVVATRLLNGHPGSGAPDGVLWLEDVDAIEVSRTWVCDSLGAALWVSGGCAGGCAVDHAVFTRNAGALTGAVLWEAADGALSRVSVVENRSGDGGAFVLRSGRLSVDHALISDPLATDDTFDVRGGDLVVADSTVFSARPGVVLAPEDAARPVFLAEPAVPDLCGPGVVPSPVAPANAPIVAWPEPEGRGALSTDCGPWCEDADGDGSPAMWDCDEADPARGDDLAEVWADGIDQDCDGVDECPLDRDGDGVAGSVGPAGDACVEEPAVWDCDDHDPERRPGASEVRADGVDQDCDGADLPEIPDPEPVPDREVEVRTACDVGGHAAVAPLLLVGLALRRRGSRHRE